MTASVEQWLPPDDPGAFELLCLDLWQEIWEDAGAQRNGRSGQPQAGVDLFGRCGEEWIGVQCKQKNGLTRKKLTRGELIGEVKAATKFKPPLGRFILATSGPRDVEIQQCARELTEQHRQGGLFAVEVWSWPDIWRELYNRKNLLKRIAAIYWPISAATWGDPDGRHIAPSALFRGKTAGSSLLIGRKGYLKKLDAAWNRPGKTNLITIVAWGGVGKTLLLTHWVSRKLAQPDRGGIEYYFDWSFYSQGARNESNGSGASHAASAEMFLQEAITFFGDPKFAVSNVDARQKGMRLAQLVGQRHALLILDGLEPLQDAKTGELINDGLRELLRGLALYNRGLCLVTTRQRLSDLAAWRNTTAPEWRLARLTDKAGAALLTKLGVFGSELEKRKLSTELKGHALTLSLLGVYLKRAHRGDIRRVDQVDFAQVGSKEQGGHAFRVISAYERYFQRNGCCTELAILRVVGLFDRPATPDCLAVLCGQSILGLTDTVPSLDDPEWNEAVTSLVEMDLLEEQNWEPRSVLGFGEQATKEQMEDGKTAKPEFFPPKSVAFAMTHSLDAHPLVREYFAKSVRDNNAEAWKTAHLCVFKHLLQSVPYWPDSIDGLVPLYQAVAHGCQAGLQQEVMTNVYEKRIRRGDVAFSTKKLGLFTADLAAMACFFEKAWSIPSQNLTEERRGWLLNQAGFSLRALGRLQQAVQALRLSVPIAVMQGDWKQASRRANNLSETELMLGNIAVATEAARQAVNYADMDDGLSWEQMAFRTLHAECLHASGDNSAAEDLFATAERLQTKRDPAHPFLYSIQGFRHSEFILDDLESQAWREFMAPKHGFETGLGNAQWLQKTRLTLENIVEWAKSAGSRLLALGLGSLELGKFNIYTRVLRYGAWVENDSYMDAAIRSLRSAGQVQELPRGLMGRAWYWALASQMDQAQADLDEAYQISIRGRMRLHLVDIHLHRARLFYNVKTYPWESPQADLASAGKAIRDCGYHRRDRELTDARKVIGS